MNIEAGRRHVLQENQQQKEVINQINDISNKDTNIEANKENNSQILIDQEG